MHFQQTALSNTRLVYAKHTFTKSSVVSSTCDATFFGKLVSRLRETPTSKARWHLSCCRRLPICYNFFFCRRRHPADHLPANGYTLPAGLTAITYRPIPYRPSKPKSETTGQAESFVKKSQRSYSARPHIIYIMYIYIYICYVLDRPCSKMMPKVL